MIEMKTKIPNIGAPTPNLAEFLLIMLATMQQWRNYNIVGNVAVQLLANTKLIPSRYFADKLLLEFPVLCADCLCFTDQKICGILDIQEVHCTSNEEVSHRIYSSNEYLQFRGTILELITVSSYAHVLPSKLKMEMGVDVKLFD
ncbi:hypothetical protein HHI36_015696 [Cryptolaemus montrouzieri]|uniref:Uncharacterized protein n=1 Tax=Cryptolaemus montrouzieri TaxID=559131 RepID=A0ABD2N6A4_9CUCU